MLFWCPEGRNLLTNQPTISIFKYHCLTPISIFLLQHHADDDHEDHLIRVTSGFIAHDGKYDTRAIKREKGKCFRKNFMATFKTLRACKHRFYCHLQNFASLQTWHFLNTFWRENLRHFGKENYFLQIWRQMSLVATSYCNLDHTGCLKTHHQNRR